MYGEQKGRMKKWDKKWLSRGWWKICFIGFGDGCPCLFLRKGGRRKGLGPLPIKRSLAPPLKYSDE